MHGTVSQLVIIFVLGALCQWASWRLRIPAILLLLGSGIAVGPLTGILQPDQLFGDLLFPIVSLAVAVILYEGGLDLHLAELSDKKRAILFLVSVGCLINCSAIAVAAHYLLGLDWQLSFLLGGVLSVSGPTVVQPLLRFIKPREPAYSILKWEGILIDPVGAVLAALILEKVLLNQSQEGFFAIVLGLSGTLVVGSIIGFAFGRLLILLSSNRSLPDELHNTFSLACLFSSFFISNLFFVEAGLVAVTVMGVVVGNEKDRAIHNIVSFKENLRVLLISSLFILLAARVDLELLVDIRVPELLFLLSIIFIARPVSVFASTAGQGLGLGDRLFISWMFPRGIVAAAVASLFAIELHHAGIDGGEILVSTVFLVIFSTVILYGLTGSIVARLLGVSLDDPKHYLFVGIGHLSLALAEILKKEQISFQLVDTNPEKVLRAKIKGFSAFQGNLLSTETLDELDIALIDKTFAMTGSLETNLLLRQRLADALGSNLSYMFIPENTEASQQFLKTTSLPMVIPSPEHSLADFEWTIQSGGSLSIIEVETEYDKSATLEKFTSHEELFIVRDQCLLPFRAKSVKPGDRLIVLGTV